MLTVIGDGVASLHPFPNVVIGPIAVLAGIAIIIFRHRATALIVKNQPRIVGKSAAARLAKSQKPVWVGVVGVSAVFMGLCALINGLTDRW